MQVYIGIDDTDNLDSRGTGYQARALGLSLEEAGLFVLGSITRHQLLVDRRIPYTSHNSSACLVGDCKAPVADLIAHCKEFLIRESAFDSDAGLCVAPFDQVTADIVAYGNLAKREVLTMADSFGMIKGRDIFLEGFKNARIGVIGSLAAVGLRAGGEDGRLLWLRNLRETTGKFTIQEFQEIVGVERVVDMDFNEIARGSEILITEWCRPVMAGGKITLIAEKANEIEPYEYQSATKDYIKSISG
ncbi:MAG: hypothetical protein WCK34_09565 [Bacteroidota bacterium]